MAESDKAIPTRLEQIRTVTCRLFWFSLLVAAAAAGYIIITATTGTDQALILLAALTGFSAGLMSIQSRLAKLGDLQLSVLASSTISTCLPPIHGGLFAVILYVLFITKIVVSPLFPEFTYSGPSFISGTDNFSWFYRYTNPVNYQDIAKVIIWSFIAGFFERFVPQILGKLHTHAEESADKRSHEARSEKSISLSQE